MFLLALVLTPRAASAHGGGDSDQALVLVRQAIAYIVNTPDKMNAITDKINDATEAKDTSGVQIPLVEQAKDAMGSGEQMNPDLHQVRALLERSIGARVHTGDADPVQIGQVPPPVTGADTGTLAALDPLPGRHGLTGGDWTLLVLCVLAGLGGLALSVLFRPRLGSIPTAGRLPTAGRGEDR